MQAKFRGTRYYCFRSREIRTGERLLLSDLSRLQARENTGSHTVNTLAVSGIGLSATVTWLE